MEKEMKWHEIEGEFVDYKKNSMNAALQCNIPNDNKEHEKLIG